MPYGQEYLGYGGAASLPAMQINPLVAGADASKATSEAQAAALTQQQQSSLSPYLMEAEKQKSQLQTTDYNNAMIAQVAREAMAAPDPGAAAQRWDAGYRKLATDGVDAANQFVGHYRDDLPQQVIETFGGAPGGRPTAPTPFGLDPAVLYQRYAALAQQPNGTATLATAVKNQNAAISAFNKIHDEASWNAQVASLKMQGINVAQALGTDQWSDLAYGMAKRHILNDITPSRDMAQSILSQQAFGLPSAPPGGAAPTKGEPFQFEGADKTNTMSAGVFNPTTGEYKPLSQAGAAADSGAYAQFAQQMTAAENGTGNPNARNPNSSATGNGQFLKDTWLSMFSAVNPSIAKNMTPQQILALRSDPALSQEMTARYAQINADELSAAGMPVTPASLAAAHRFGAQGAEQLLRMVATAPNTPLSQVFDSKVMAANPQLRGQTAGGYAQGLIQQFGDQAIATAGQTGSAPLGVISDKTARGIAEQYYAGDPHAIAAQIGGWGKLRAINQAKVESALDDVLSQNGETRGDLADRLATFNRTASTFAGGIQGNSIRALNAAMAHMDVLRTLGDALKNGNVQAINAAKNAYEEQFGGVAPSTYDALKPLVANEVAKAVMTSGGGVSDRAEFKDALARAKSFGQIDGVLTGYQNLFGGQLNAFRAQYQAGTGRSDFEKMLTPETRTVLERQTAQRGSGGPQKFTEGQVLVQGGNRFKVENGKPVFIGAVQ